jgi:maltoporin
MWVGKKLYRKKKVPNTAAFYVSVSSRGGKKLNPEKKLDFGKPP